ncbi:MAG: histidinol-phosphate transaminase [Candidatus Omnitrophica bacterium]|nr:histidinol-phosphate transaminase [Candidatus Omnitrophota bacterium]
MNLKHLVRPCVCSIKPYVPGKPIEELKRELKLKNVYKMASNENALGPSLKAVSALKKSLRDIHFYPDGNCFYLKKALAKKYNLNNDNIIVGNGSDELIVLSLRAFINKGDEVIIADPTFLVYKLAATIEEAKIITVPLKAFRYDLPAMKAKINSRTKMIFIANPDNPTGSYVTQSEVESFFKGLPEHVIVFFDEAYYEYQETKDYPDTMKYIGHKNIIISRSFSKAYGLGGMRVGWAAANKEMISYLNQVREPFNVNRLAQAAAVAALEDKKHILKSRQMVRCGKRYFYNEFKKIRLFFVPSAANFVLVNVGMNSTVVYQKLLQQGIIVRDMTDWGLKNFIRVTIGKPKENKLFISHLKKIIGKHK